MGKACGTYRLEETRHGRFSWGNLKEKGYLEDLNVGGRVMLKYILNKCDGGAWTGLIWHGIGTSCGM